MKGTMKNEGLTDLPVKTNRINVSWDQKLFFQKYSIVSYYSRDRYKNLAYEHLSDVPFLAVTGIWDRYDYSRYPVMKFFVLVEKGKDSDVLRSLREMEAISSKIDDLEQYNTNQQHRIIASLAINFLGKKRNGMMMYNDGSLYVSDSKNFLVPKSRKELVCLKIEINEYLILSAKTKSFSNPYNKNELLGHKNNVFSIARDINGDYWDGQAVKPVAIKNLEEGKYKLEDLYILKKRCSGYKNNVPYWPYCEEDYNHGKLFVLNQVVESVKKEFGGIIGIDFSEYQPLDRDSCKPDKEMLKLIREYLSGKSVYFEDPFKTEGSKAIIKQFVEHSQELGCILKFPKRKSADDMVIRLCEPIGQDSGETYYYKSNDRKSRGAAIQHIIYHDDKREDEITKVDTRRMLIDFIVKESLRKRVMPTILTPLLEGWTFYEYKIKDKRYVNGCSLSVGDDGGMCFINYGLSDQTDGIDYEPFIHQCLKYADANKINGYHDYMALAKEGNVYLIIDTDEIPILEVDLIDEGYDKVVNHGESLSLFKRKAESHKYLRGYMGFHLWRSDGIDGVKDAAFSYISGNNSENMKITQTTRMDKMPRARRIFVLHAGNSERVDTHIFEIKDMLKFGFGRWNEMMTYPFPFKFIKEYLDDVCETVFSKHWSSLT